MVDVYNEKLSGVPENVLRALNEFTSLTLSMLGDSTVRVILYGSYARADYNSSSDVDLFVLTDMKDTEIPGLMSRLAYAVYDINEECDVLIEPYVKNVAEYYDFLPGHPFYQNIEKEGIILYDRTDGKTDTGTSEIV